MSGTFPSLPALLCDSLMVFSRTAQLDCFSLWGHTNKHLFNSERALMTDQRKSSKVHLNKPKNFILLTSRSVGVGTRMTQLQPHHKKPTSAWWQFLKAVIREHPAELADRSAGSECFILVVSCLYLSQAPCLLSTLQTSLLFTQTWDERGLAQLVSFRDFLKLFCLPSCSRSFCTG